MRYRTGLDIKKDIIRLLKEKERSISEMETKLNTSDRVIKRHLNELEFLGIVKVIRHKRSPKTGRAYVTAEIIR